jgi:hypothetical protein
MKPLEIKNVETIKNLEFHINQGSTLVHITKGEMSVIDTIDRSTYSFNFIESRFIDNKWYTIQLENIFFIQL